MQYRHRGWLTLEKVDPPVRIVQGRYIPQANPFLDFTGAWTERGGRSLHVEAKDVDTDSLKVDGSPGIGASQRENILRWCIAKATVFVLWHRRGEVMLLTPEIIQRAVIERKAGERRARAVHWSEGIPVPRGIGYVTHDFRAIMCDLWTG